MADAYLHIALLLLRRRPWAGIWFAYSNKTTLMCGGPVGGTIRRRPWTGNQYSAN